LPEQPSPQPLRHRPGRKPLLQNPSFCRSGFSRDPSSSRTGVPGYRAASQPLVIETPLLQNPSFCRSGFSRDPLRHQARGSSRTNPCVIARGYRTVEQPSSRTRSSQPLCHRGQRVRGESPSYRTHLFVGAASAATLCVIENQGFRVTEAAFTATLASSRMMAGSRPA
jgi:hypothetical protein